MNDELDSTGIWYFVNGQPSAEEYYDHGILISGKYWNEKGKRETIKRPGLQKPFYKDENGYALMKYLADNIRYPNEARKNNISGRVVVKFVIDTEGNVTDQTVLTSVHPLLDAEALRVVGSMPKWTPGEMHNRPVKVYFTLPITFALE
jgi:TonB family protein